MTSCLGNDLDDIKLGSESSITAFSIGTVWVPVTGVDQNGNDSVYLDSIDCSGYPFTIDQLNRRIENKDSLPVGADVSRVLTSLTSDGSVWYTKRSDAGIENDTVAAQALLGQKAAQPDGGDRFESEYTSELGTLTLTRTGGFSAVLTGGAHVRNYEKSAAKLLHSMGFQFQQLSRRQTEAGVTLEAEQTLLGVPVLGSQLALSYTDDCLTAVEGTFYTGGSSITRVSEQEAISAADALAQLLARRDALGWVGSTVTSLTQGYLPSDQAGTGIRFVPVWLVETDAGSFFINGITREITAET